MSVKEENKIAWFIMLGMFVFFNIIRFFLFPDQDLQWHLFAALFGLVVILIIGYVVRVVDVFLDSKFPFERNVLTRLALQFLLTISIIGIIRAVSAFVLSTAFNFHPPKDMVITSIALNISMVLSLILSIFGYHFFKRWKEGEIRAAELSREKALVQYDNLKNQLNPHFLFNALSSLNSLISENPKLASEFLQQLSKVYRYVLENKEKSTVTLEKEIAFVQHYINLLETRFGEGFSVQINVNNDALDKLIVPVTLQILIENAIKHNTTGKDSPLQMAITDDGEYLSVTNNLQRRKVIENSNGIGMVNLKNLYQHVSTAELKVVETDTFYQVKIPLL